MALFLFSKFGHDFTGSVQGVEFLFPGPGIQVQGRWTVQASSQVKPLRLGVGIIDHVLHKI